MEIFELLGMLFNMVVTIGDALDVISWPFELIDALLEPSSDSQSRHRGD